MNRKTNPQRDKYQGFTLIEVVFTIGIAALLMSAISLNISVQPALQKTATELPDQESLIQRIDDIFLENTIAELIQLVGVDEDLNALSDPDSVTNRKLVSIDTQLVGSSGNQTSVYVIEITSNNGSIKRWFYP